METTQLYIELIIIGLESFIWMSISLINILGNRIVNVFKDVISNFSSSLLLIGVLYIIGVLIDRLADMIFQKRESKIRSESGLKAKSSLVIWRKYGARKYAEYSRSRIRILRASILNIPLITVAFIWNFFSCLDKSYIIIYIFIMGIVFSCVSWKAYNLSLEKYYSKAYALENVESDEKQI